MGDLSRVCNLHYSSQQCQIFNPLSNARDQTRNLVVTRQICFCCTMMGNPFSHFKMGEFTRAYHKGLLRGLNELTYRKYLKEINLNICCYDLFICFCLFRATPSAYGGSRARGLLHSKGGSKPHLRPTPQLTKTPDL